MVIKNSVEENIVALQEKKSKLAKETLMDRDDHAGGSKNKKKSSAKAVKEVEKRRRLADLRELFKTKAPGKKAVDAGKTARGPLDDDSESDEQEAEEGHGNNAAGASGATSSSSTAPLPFVKLE